ncbi:uncharacterized protein EV154DRAFT_606557 [Mucor mucedo]|uniref:uncharacterized protein n=1 Tax=Mucor mucedo TaxID=29922 RepID=UPI0022202DB3|nr:uncharacterized protein EV154DRAFT_606557 [Mucor mucedo]KAI7877324.1 hypothetical protein EV154DRAFT_606557 [Mucor mucedo]
MDRKEVHKNMGLLKRSQASLCYWWSYCDTVLEGFYDTLIPNKSALIICRAISLLLTYITAILGLYKHLNFDDESTEDFLAIVAHMFTKKLGSLYLAAFDLFDIFNESIWLPIYHTIDNAIETCLGYWFPHKNIVCYQHTSMPDQSDFFLDKLARLLHLKAESKRIEEIRCIDIGSTNQKDYSSTLCLFVVLYLFAVIFLRFKINQLSKALDKYNDTLKNKQVKNINVPQENKSLLRRKPPKRRSKEVVPPQNETFLQKEAVQQEAAQQEDTQQEATLQEEISSLQEASQAKERIQPKETIMLHKDNIESKEDLPNEKIPLSEQNNQLETDDRKEEGPLSEESNDTKQEENALLGKSMDVQRPEDDLRIENTGSQSNDISPEESVDTKIEENTATEEITHGVSQKDDALAENVVNAPHEEATERNKDGDRIYKSIMMTDKQDTEYCIKVRDKYKMYLPTEKNKILKTEHHKDAKGDNRAGPSRHLPQKCNDLHELFIKQLPGKKGNTTILSKKPFGSPTTTRQELKEKEPDQAGPSQSRLPELTRLQEFVKDQMAQTNLFNIQPFGETWRQERAIKEILSSALASKQMQGFVDTEIMLQPEETPESKK